jgi:hypothetical protein
MGESEEIEEINKKKSVKKRWWGWAGDKPSLMLDTPGCWAREDMGAWFAGVF